MNMNRIDPQSWKADLPEFKEKTAAFYACLLYTSDAADE